jgi:tetratricopeptide (TPR) repeat protein
MGDRRNEGTTLNNLANAFRGLGETRRAIEHHNQALVIARETGDWHNEGAALGSLGDTYANLGETRRAIAHYDQALVIE